MVAIVPVVDEGLGNSSYLVELGEGGRWWSTRSAIRPPTWTWPTPGGCSQDLHHCGHPLSTRSTDDRP